ncbi:MAG: TonB-dependent receptor plug domain-containing protein, partial [Pseudomonadota bacterium]
MKNALVANSQAAQTRAESGTSTLRRARPPFARSRLAVACLSCAAVPLATVSSALAQEPELIREEIVVTGSRIATDSATSSSSPVTVIGGDTVRTAGQVDLGELLRESPALNNSLPANFSALQDPEDGETGSTSSDLGIGFLDLRGLGTVRTLVLVNGRRHVAGSQGSAAVDVNTIPITMVKRVETLTGGASSVYGADAVSGVVNFLLREGGDFDGIEFTSQTGISSEGDSEEYLLSGAGGFEFSNGRGNIVFGVEYLRSNELIDNERDFTGPNIGNDINNAPEIAALTGRNPDAQRVYVRPTGNPISSPLGVFDITNIDAFGTIDSILTGGTPGAAIPIIPGTEGFNGGIPQLQVIDTPTGGVPRAYDPGFAVNSSQSFLVGDGLGSVLGTTLPDQERIIINFNGGFDFNDSHGMFFETKYALSETSERFGVADFNDSIPIAYDNPYIPAALA